jgi:actin cytoskeleton-regulatory complex protein PAN1
MEDNLSSSGSEDDFHSLPDSSDEENDDQKATHRENDVDREAREHERRLVLEAAGLIVRHNSDSPRPRQRPPAPRIPRRKSTSLPEKDLPPFPEPVSMEESRVDDAFERYEEFKKAHGDINLKRLSSASSTTETYPSLPSPASITFSASRDGESRSYSNFFHFFGRNKTQTTENEKPKSSLVISGPISDPNDIPRRENSPAFGMVGNLVI